MGNGPIRGDAISVAAQVATAINKLIFGPRWLTICHNSFDLADDIIATFPIQTMHEPAGTSLGPPLSEAFSLAVIPHVCRRAHPQVVNVKTLSSFQIEELDFFF